jgi:hypothetical protein
LAGGSAKIAAVKMSENNNIQGLYEVMQGWGEKLPDSKTFAKTFDTKYGAVKVYSYLQERKSKDPKKYAAVPDDYDNFAAGIGLANQPITDAEIAAFQSDGWNFDEQTGMLSPPVPKQVVPDDNFYQLQLNEIDDAIKKRTQEGKKAPAPQAYTAHGGTGGMGYVDLKGLFSAGKQENILAAAERLNISAQNTLDAPRSNKDKAWYEAAIESIQHFGRKTAETLPTILSWGIMDAADANVMSSIFKKIDDAQAYDNPEKVLNNDEQLYLDAFANKTAIDIYRAGDQTTGAKVADISANMVSFIADMFTAGKIVKGGAAALRMGERALIKNIAGRVTARLAKSNAVGKMAGRFSINAGKAAVYSGAQNIISPQTYANTMKNLYEVNPNEHVAYDVDGKLHITGSEKHDWSEAFAAAVKDGWIERFTEAGGIGGAFVSAILKTPLLRRTIMKIGKHKVGELYKAYKESIGGKAANQLFFHGVGGEGYEELEGAMLRGELDDFFTSDNLVPMVISFGITAAAFGSIGAADYAISRTKYINANARIDKNLAGYGMSADDIAGIKESLLAAPLEEAGIIINENAISMAANKYMKENNITHADADIDKIISDPSVQNDARAAAADMSRWLMRHTYMEAMSTRFKGERQSAERNYSAPQQNDDETANTANPTPAPPAPQSRDDGGMANTAYVSNPDYEAWQQQAAAVRQQWQPMSNSNGSIVLAAHSGGGRYFILDEDPDTKLVIAAPVQQSADGMLSYGSVAQMPRSEFTINAEDTYSLDDFAASFLEEAPPQFIEQPITTNTTENDEQPQIQDGDSQASETAEGSAAGAGSGALPAGDGQNIDSEDTITLPFVRDGSKDARQEQVSFTMSDDAYYSTQTYNTEIAAIAEVEALAAAGYASDFEIVQQRVGSGIAAKNVFRIKATPNDTNENTQNTTKNETTTETNAAAARAAAAAQNAQVHDAAVGGFPAAVGELVHTKANERASRLLHVEAQRF